MLKRISFISLQSYDQVVQLTVYTAVLEKMNSIGQLFFSHRMLLITNYRLSHLKIKMMGAKSPKTNFIAEKQKELEKLLVGYGAFRNLLLILDYNFIKTTTAYVQFSKGCMYPCYRLRYFIFKSIQQILDFTFLTRIVSQTLS